MFPPVPLRSPLLCLLRLGSLVFCLARQVGYGALDRLPPRRSLGRRMTVAIGLMVLFAPWHSAFGANWLQQVPQVAPSRIRPENGSAVSPAKSQADPGRLPPSDRDRFVVRPGFQVELLFTVPKETHGSWVSLATDPKGRILACDQGDKGLSRITPPAIGSGEPTRVEKLDTEITSAQGMIWAYGALYVSVNGGPGSGLYRVSDSDRDDSLDHVERLKPLRGGGEHGPHSLRIGPDGKTLYVVAGNHTDVPDGFQASRIPSYWGEDLLLPRQWDARGHARGKLAPGGWIANTDPRARRWEIFSIGYRNTYDMDFNDEGELFAYDADMEWDLGSPWYRPTRLLHAVSGSEFGWRSGTGKWPDYYLDSLPSVVDIGPGSPTGVTFGRGTTFPRRYQQAIYLLDWTFGTMYAVHLTPRGASYVGQKEEFVARAALPLTDALVGSDGALYFAVGGRGTQSALYRVTYTAPIVDEPQIEPAEAKRLAQCAELRRQRRWTEQFHRPGSLEGRDADFQQVWDQLGHQDRHIRYASRIALEHQPVDTWKDQALDEPRPTARLQALAALARAGGHAHSGDPQAKDQLRGQVLEALWQLDFSQLSNPLRLDLLRVYALTFIRLGPPDARQASVTIARLNDYFPAPDDDLRVNHELARVLVFLNAPGIVQRCLALMEREYPDQPERTAELLGRNPGYGETIAKMLANKPEIEKLHYAFLLRNVRYGWTLEERRKYLQWLAAARERSGGASYQGFVDNIRKDALANMSPAERAALAADASTQPRISDAELPKPQGPGHPWTVDEVVQLAGRQLTGRDFENGRKMFLAARCVICHRFDGQGGATGPDLTSVSGRFSIKDMAEAIIEPSKVISDQYRASTVETVNGKVITGRIVGEEDGKIVVQTNPEDASQIVQIAKADIERIEPSAKSLMPDDLLNGLNDQEVLDLFAYLLSRGNPKDLMFQ